MVRTPVRSENASGKAEIGVGTRYSWNFPILHTGCLNAMSGSTLGSIVLRTGGLTVAQDDMPYWVTGELVECSPWRPPVAAARMVTSRSGGISADTKMRRTNGTQHEQAVT